jgi:hypothetical protein
MASLAALVQQREGEMQASFQQQLQEAADKYAAKVCELNAAHCSLAAASRLSQ